MGTSCFSLARILLGAFIAVFSTGESMSLRNRAVITEMSLLSLPYDFISEWMRFQPTELSHRALARVATDHAPVKSRPASGLGITWTESMLPAVKRFRLPLGLTTAGGVGVSSFCLIRAILLNDGSLRRWIFQISCCLTGLLFSASLHYLV